MAYSSTLVGDVSSSDTSLYVAVAPTAPYPPYLTIDSEVVAIVSVNPSFTITPHPAPRIHISVQRGALGTTRATHSDGATVSGGSGSGSGVSVDNGTDPPAAVTTLVARGAVLSGGSATLPLAFRLLESGLITYQTVGLDDPDAPVQPFSVADGQFAIGDVILDVWLDVIEFFDGPNNAEAHLAAFQLPGTWTDLYATRPDIAFNRTETNNGGDHPALGQTDFTSNVVSLLDVRSNNVAALANSDSFMRVLPARVTTADFAIGIYLGNGPGWTQGQLRIYAIVGTPAS